MKSGAKPRRLKRRTKAQIDELVRRWRAGGQSISKFCGEQGISPSSMYQWAAQRADADAMPNALRGTPTFTEVSVTGSVSRAAPDRECALTIVTTAGYQISIARDGVDKDLLRTVLSVVSAC